jgi:hypothetical protein
MMLDFSSDHRNAYEPSVSHVRGLTFRENVPVMI